MANEDINTPVATPPTPDFEGAAQPQADVNTSIPSPIPTPDTTIERGEPVELFQPTVVDTPMAPATSEPVETLETDITTDEPVPVDEPDLGFTGTEIKEVEEFETNLQSTDYVGANNRRTVNTQLRQIQEAQEQDGFSIEQARPLAQRNTVNDQFDIRQQSLPDGTFDVSVRSYGSKSKNGSAGNTKKYRAKVRKSRVGKAAKSVVNYGTKYKHLDSRGKAVGAFQTFFDVIDPFFDSNNRPGFSMANNNVDTINFGKEMADSFNIYANWDKISDTSRFQATARQMTEMASELGYQLPSVANGLNMTNFGFAAYTLLNDWTKMNPAQRMYGVVNAINAGQAAYTGGQAIFSSYTGAAQAGTSASASGAVSAGGSAIGGGGAAAPAAATVSTPAELAAWNQAATEAGGGLAGTGTGQAGSEVGASYASYVGYAASAYAAYNIIDQWGQGGAGGRVNGAANGAAIGMSIYGPIGAAVGAVLGLAIGSISTGKSAEQGKRDAYRNVYEKQGVFEKLNGSHQIQLASGEFYDVGVDGGGSRAVYKGEKKSVYDPTKITDRDMSRVSSDKKIRPYNVDYTSDLDFMTSLATQGLNAIMNGGSNYKSGEGRQMNGYLTNAATSDLDSRDFTEKNFEDSMANVRTFYSKIGIESRQDALEYVEYLKVNKRLSTDDYNAIRLGIEFAFPEEGNSGYERAQQVRLELGRDKGAPTQEQLEAADEKRKKSREEFRVESSAEEERRRAIQEAFA